MPLHKENSPFLTKYIDRVKPKCNIRLLFKILKGIEFLSQNLIFLSLYLCISMSETLDISNFELF